MTAAAWTLLLLGGALLALGLSAWRARADRRKRLAPVMEAIHRDLIAAIGEDAGACAAAGIGVLTLGLALAAFVVASVLS